jgi:hypothetical protein
VTQIFLLVTGNWQDPGDWDPTASNTVECLGQGGNGGGGYVDNAKAGSGGGGGAYAKATNMVLTFPVPYVVGAQCTNFNTSSATFVNSGNVVSAQAGAAATSSTLGNLGLGGTSFYPTGFRGGNGGSGAIDISAYGGGGGGAGGPSGLGDNGREGGSGVSAAGRGGAANGGVVAGGLLAVNGNNGTQWDATHGCGSGGGGGKPSPLTKGGNGGNYGGGGGGSPNDTIAGMIGTGGAGLIIITYTPLPKTQIFLFSTGTHGQVQYFNDPGDWNPTNNSVEIVGAGGNGRQGATGGANPGSGPGGGGGAYAKGVNLSPVFPVPYVVGVPLGDGQTYHTVFGTTDYFNGTGALVRAGCGRMGTTGTTGGGGGNVFFPTGFNGGNGGSGTAGTGALLLAVGVEPFGAVNDRGGGGGGAAGPHGIGLNGGNGTASALGVGGMGDNGFGGQGGDGTSGAVSGFGGGQWGTAGCGGGGAGSAATGPGTFGAGNGGNYGGGGGGGAAVAGRTTPGTGGPGLIIITYLPLKKSGGFNMPFMGL